MAKHQPIEIEAKFAVPDPQTFRRLLAAETLAGMHLLPGLTREIHDHYLDTARQGFRRGGYACRLRVRGDQRLITLKGLGGAQGAIHQRAEHETILPPGATLDPSSWPAGSVRALAMELGQGHPLQPLVDLHQTRHTRTLADDERTVAEVSLDDVRTGETTYLELEVELALAGTVDDLRRVVDDLVGRWKLTPEPRSKFERALDTLNESRSA